MRDSLNSRFYYKNFYDYFKKESGIQRQHFHIIFTVFRFQNIDSLIIYTTIFYYSYLLLKKLIHKVILIKMKKKTTKTH